MYNADFAMGHMVRLLESGSSCYPYNFITLQVFK